jgi:plastocyanin
VGSTWVRRVRHHLGGQGHQAGPGDLGDPQTAKDGSFSSEPLVGGKGFRVMFDHAGNFAYYCAIHPTMTGTIQVTAPDH